MGFSSGMFIGFAIGINKFFFFERLKFKNNSMTQFLLCTYVHEMKYIANVQSFDIFVKIKTRIIVDKN